MFFLLSMHLKFFLDFQKDLRRMKRRGGIHLFYLQKMIKKIIIFLFFASNFISGKKKFFVDETKNNKFFKLHHKISVKKFISFFIISIFCAMILHARIHVNNREILTQSSCRLLRKTLVLSGVYITLLLYIIRYSKMALRRSYRL